MMLHRKKERRRRLSSRSFKLIILPLLIAATILFTRPNTLYSTQFWTTVHLSTSSQLQNGENLHPPSLNLTKYVDPFIGTGGQGHTYPGATVPFGMVQLSPDNGEQGWEYSSGYHYSSSTTIIGFSHTHLSGTGIGDLLDISVQPTTNPLDIGYIEEFWPETLLQKFNHSNEIAQPGYYKVFLDHGVQVELTTTERTGMHRYTFYPSKAPRMKLNPGAFSGYLPGIVLNLCFTMNYDVLESSMIELTNISSSRLAPSTLPPLRKSKTGAASDPAEPAADGSSTSTGTVSSVDRTHRTIITGFRRSLGWADDHRVFFAMEFSVPFHNVTLIEDNTAKEFKKGAKRIVAKGKGAMAYFTFDNNNSGSNSALRTNRKSTSTSSTEERKIEEEEEEEQPLVVLLKVGLSSVSVQGAEENLNSENPSWDFDAVKDAAKEAWESELSKIIVQGGDEESKTVFYTSLYHTKMAPTLLSDVGGAYRGPDVKIYRGGPGSEATNSEFVGTFESERNNNRSQNIKSCTAANGSESAFEVRGVSGVRKNNSDSDGENFEEKKDSEDSCFPYYSTFSIWDTFRAAHPLLTILNPDRVKDMMRTFLAYADHQNGMLPIWPLAGVETKTMPGYHAVVSLAEASVKNLLSNTDRKRAFDAMMVTSKDNERGGRLMDRYGYIPADNKHESVTVTLELSYDDWCIAQMAETVNNSNQAVYFYNRSTGYQHVFDPETQFMRAKWKNNTWKTPFNPRHSEHTKGDYTEGTAWQHLWFVPHDIPGLIKLFNGSDAFEAKLDALFRENSTVLGDWASEDISGMIGQYAHGNEPSHHVAYLYNYVGSPHKTQARVRQIMKEMYSSKVDGLTGNEDCGQMSAWYIFSALGFYPVNPAEAIYQLGSPSFDNAVIEVGQGQKFEVKAEGAGTSGDVYVKKVKLNGEVLDRWYITHAEIMNGGVLELEMSSEPSSV